MIEWEDSCQPSSAWAFLASVPEHKPVHCVSVGWLIQDGAEVKVLAPNFGCIDNDASVQASGVIRDRKSVTLNTKESPDTSGPGFKEDIGDKGRMDGRLPMSRIKRGDREMGSPRKGGPVPQVGPWRMGRRA